ncbi:MAG: hypothetical protein ACKVTZ_22495 [Bacteroidia bacterium]
MKHLYYVGLCCLLFTLTSSLGFSQNASSSAQELLAHTWSFDANKMEMPANVNEAQLSRALRMLREMFIEFAPDGKLLSARITRNEQGEIIEKKVREAYNWRIADDKTLILSDTENEDEDTYKIIYLTEKELEIKAEDKSLYLKR